MPTVVLEQRTADIAVNEERTRLARHDVALVTKATLVRITREALHNIANTRAPRMWT